MIFLSFFFNCISKSLPWRWLLTTLVFFSFDILLIQKVFPMVYIDIPYIIAFMFIKSVCFPLLLRLKLTRFKDLSPNPYLLTHVLFSSVSRRVNSRRLRRISSRKTRSASRVSIPLNALVTICFISTERRSASAPSTMTFLRRFKIARLGFSYVYCCWTAHLRSPCVSVRFFLYCYGFRLVLILSWQLNFHQIL